MLETVGFFHVILPKGMNIFPVKRVKELDFQRYSRIGKGGQ
jgi:hypothetical protein